MPRILTEPVGSCTEPEAADLLGDQPRAFRSIVSRLECGEKVTKLCGFAGTGKTTLLIRVAAWAVRRGFQVSVAAPTHKAVGVVREKIESWQQATRRFLGVECSTIHSLLGLLLVNDLEHDTGERMLHAVPSTKREELASWGKPLVIVDEASMIGAALRFHIEQARQVQWLFVGDPAQLPPVGEGPSTFLQRPHAMLTRIQRQCAGSEIINLATRIRRGDLSMAFDDGPSCQVSQLSEAEMVSAAVGRFGTEEFDLDPSHARILVFRNSRRVAFNQLVRRELMPDAPQFAEREWLVMGGQFSPDVSELNQLFEHAKTFVKGEPGHGAAWRRAFEFKELLEERRQAGERPGAFLHVSQEVRIIHVSRKVVEVGSDTFPCWHLTVVTRAGESESGEIMQLPVLTDDVRPLHHQRIAEAVADAQEVRRQMNEFLEPLTEKEQEAAILSREWKELDGIRRGHWNRYFTLLDTFADVDRPFCLTTHKSQGSTFRHVFVDAADLLSSGGMRNPLLYTAVTRPSDSLTFCL